MRIPAAVRGVLAMSVVVGVLAPPAHATWSEQGVVVATLQHAWAYDPATLLHDPGGAYFAYLPYSFGDCLLHLDATQASAWVKDAAFFHAPPASEFGNAVALDGSGGLFLFECDEARLRHVPANGAEDWGPGGAGLVVDAGPFAGVALAADGGGGVWGAWGFGTGGGVRLQHWLANGTVAPGWGPLGLLFPGTLFPALARDDAGGVVLAFASTGDMRMHVTRVQADAAIAPGWTAAGLDLGAFGFSSGDFHPLLVPSGETGWIAVWPGELPTMTSAVARRFLEDGALDPTWAGGAPLAMVTYASPDDHPCTFSDGAGGFHHVWSDSATRAPRWLHVTSSGGYATGFGWNGIAALRAGDALASGGNFVAASSDNGGIVLAWDDSGAGRTPAVRLRWFLPDGAADPAAPETGRVIPGTNGESHVWGLDAGLVGGVFTLWSNQTHVDYEKLFLMNFMRREPYVVDAPPVPAAAPLALAAPRPTPTRGPLDVRCTLPGEAPATLALFDVTGRRVRGVTLQGAGEHVARLDAAGDLPPGVYLLRLTQGRASRSARAVVVR